MVPTRGGGGGFFFTWKHDWWKKRRKTEREIGMEYGGKSGGHTTLTQPGLSVWLTRWITWLTAYIFPNQPKNTKIQWLQTSFSTTYTTCDLPLSLKRCLKKQVWETLHDPIRTAKCVKIKYVRTLQKSFSAFFGEGRHMACFGIWKYCTQGRICQNSSSAGIGKKRIPIVYFLFHQSQAWFLNRRRRWNQTKSGEWKGWKFFLLCAAFK